MWLFAVHREGFGVFDQLWQPNSTLVRVLAAGLHTFKKVNAGPEAYAALNCWHWGSVFLERYVGSVETMYRDAMDPMRLERAPGFRPAVFGDIRLRLLKDKAFTLRPGARVNSVFYGVMNIIAIEGARNFAKKRLHPVSVA